MKVESTTEYRGITLQQALGLVSITLEDGYTLDMGFDKRKDDFIITESLPLINTRSIVDPHINQDLLKNLIAIAEAMKHKELSEAVWIVYDNGAESMRITGDKENPPVITSTIAKDEKGVTKQGFSIATGMQSDEELPTYLKACGIIFDTPNRLINDSDGQFGFTYGVMALVMDCVSARRLEWERM